MQNTKPIYVKPTNQELAERLAKHMGWDYLKDIEWSYSVEMYKTLGYVVRPNNPYRFKFNPAEVHEDAMSCVRAAIASSEDAWVAFSDYLDYMIEPSDIGDPELSFKGCIDRMFATPEQVARACDYAFWWSANPSADFAAFPR